MSGGVDSAVTAWLLKQEGYEVRGIVLRLWEEENDKNKIWTERTCCHVPMVEYLCNRILEIPFEIVDVAKSFQNKVVKPFQEDYAKGETPNPCTTCNADIKISTLMALSKSRGTDMIATGHYASWKYSNTHQAMGLMMARDPRKDQSYFLARTREISPENFLLPLGHLTKDEVREIASNAGFPVSGMLENQEACFVSEKRVSEFLEKTMGDPSSVEKWKAIDEGGNLLGTVKNGIGLTRGQRRGVGIAGGEKLYVLDINPGKKEVTLTPKERLLETYFSIKEPMGALFDEVDDLSEKPLQVRFRSTMKPVPCRLISKEHLLFALNQSHDGIVSGQVAAFYDETGILVGSGIITKNFR